MNITEANPEISMTATGIAIATSEPPEMDEHQPLCDVRVHIRTTDDIVTVRQQSRSLSLRAGFIASDRTIIATAISEIARNIVEHAGEGDITISLVSEADHIGVRVRATDGGPGIDDLSTVMRDGYSTEGHLGIGLPGARRLMDAFDIVSMPGQGTTVTMTKWR